jgi:hypothetical protein
MLACTIRPRTTLGASRLFIIVEAADQIEEHAAKLPNVSNARGRATAKTDDAADGRVRHDRSGGALMSESRRGRSLGYRVTLKLHETAL